MSSLQEYIIKRFIYTGITLFAASVIIFALTQLLPGSVGEMILGQFATEEAVEAIESDLGLDQPAYIQYLSWLSGVLTGDWGTSYFWGESVSSLIFTRLMRTLSLTFVSLILILVIAIPMGIIAALYRGESADTGITGLAYLGISIPDFVTGTVLLAVFAGPIFPVFPIGGHSPIQEGVVDWLMHIVLPATTITIIAVAHIVRQTRTGMIKALQSEYVRTARLKGMSEKRVVIHHAIRNGILPAITVIAFTVGWLIGSVVIVEEIFSYPGLGQLAIQSIQNRDIPVIQLVMLIFATAYILSNTAADLLYSYLNPKIEYGES